MKRDESSKHGYSLMYPGESESIPIPTRKLFIRSVHSLIVLNVSQSIRRSSVFFAPAGLRSSGCRLLAAFNAYSVLNRPSHFVPVLRASVAAFSFAFEASPFPETCSIAACTANPFVTASGIIFSLPHLGGETPTSPLFTASWRVDPLNFLSLGEVSISEFMRRAMALDPQPRFPLLLLAMFSCSSVVAALKAVEYLVWR